MSLWRRLGQNRIAERSELQQLMRLGVMKWLLAAIGIGVAACVAYFFVMRNFIPPAFDVRQVSSDANGVRIEIRPNSIVNSIRKIEVKHARRSLLKLEGAHPGKQSFDIPGEILSGDTLSIVCELQFDRFFAACITEVENPLIVE